MIKIILRSNRSVMYKMSFILVLYSSVFISVQAQTQYRPGLFFREDFKETPEATPVTNDHLSDKNLVLGFYGPGCDSIKKSHHEKPADDPFYVWSGLCRGNWVLTLKNKNSYVDLSNYSKILWRSKQAGLRILHVVLKLADGTWLVSVQGEGRSADWKITEFNLSELEWYSLDIKSVIEKKQVQNPDLSKVDEIGFTDLMPGGGSDACSRLDWIEVYGKPIARK